MLHVGLATMAYLPLGEDKRLLLVVELAVMLSAWIAYKIFRSLTSPVRLLNQGAAALADKDFSVKLMPTGSAEMDRVVKVYNNMMAHEVNNSNAAVISVLRSLLEATTDSEAELPNLCREYLPVVINRAENMTLFMHNFARVVRLPAPTPRRTDLNAVLRRIGDVMASILRENDITLTY